MLVDNSFLKEEMLLKTIAKIILFFCTPAGAVVDRDSILVTKDQFHDEIFLSLFSSILSHSSSLILGNTSLHSLEAIHMHART